MRDKTSIWHNALRVWIFVFVVGLTGCATPHEKLSKALDRGDAEIVGTILKEDFTSKSLFMIF